MTKEIILKYIESKELDALKELLAQAEEMEFLHAFYDLASEEQVITFRLLNKDYALSIFEQLDIEEQQNLLRSFADDKVVEFVNTMAPDDRARLLDEMPASVAKKLLDAISPKERAATNLIMGYQAETAGRIMTTEYISLNKDLTAEAALAKVRSQAKDRETIYTLFVTDSTKKLEGVLTLKELLTANESEKLVDIMSKKPISVSTSTDQEEAAKTLQELDLLALPVVDAESLLVGIITIDDAVDILEEEATEDIFIQSGLASVTSTEADRSETLVHGSPWKIWRVRLPFLLITLVAGMAAGAVVAGFEEALESIAAVAIFIPLIMDMGGNVGTQSSTIFVRGMVLGHINTAKFLRHFVKEIGIGLGMGLIIGAASGVIAALWQGIPQLGFAVGLALTFTMTLAALLGFLIPFVLIKLNVDQAAGSAPIITSIKDIAGLVIYFLLVVTFLNHLM